MKIIVYADMLFLINFIINIIILKITSIFAKTNPTLLRLIFAASLGAIYALFMFYPNLKLLYIFPAKITISALMVIITNPKSHFWRLCKLCAVFYLVSFTFAGILLSLIYFTNFARDASPIISNGIFYFDISLKNLIVTSVISYLLIKIASAIFSRNKMLGIRTLQIIIGERKCILNALSDTGNLLTDPLSNRPVIIAEKSGIEALFPDGVPDCELHGSFKGNFRIIPYSSLGNSSGIMAGFVPDKIIIDGYETDNVIIGISNNVLSATNEYNALFNPNILNTGRS